jgi:hypothetical protein
MNYLPIFMGNSSLSRLYSLVREAEENTNRNHTLVNRVV